MSQGRDAADGQNGKRVSTILRELVVGRTTLRRSARHALAVIQN
jgi:hypothetical protein